MIKITSVVDVYIITVLEQEVVARMIDFECQEIF